MALAFDMVGNQELKNTSLSLWTLLLRIQRPEYRQLRLWHGYIHLRCICRIAVAAMDGEQVCTSKGLLEGNNTVAQCWNRVPNQQLQLQYTAAGHGSTTEDSPCCV